jgi:predicted nucleic acid-binding protein
VTGWLLDTNVLSELRRPKPDRKVVAFIAASRSNCFTSVR